MAIPGNFLSAATSSMDPVVTGWTPQLNCTISKGTGGRVGDGCLAVKSTAAGEMQARIVGSVLVTAGTVYYTFADASGTVPERIGIRWLDKAGTVLGTTWSLSTMTASSSWHRVSVAGQAPAGTTRAQVILSSTPAAANVYHYYENVFFGLPMRQYGNLFAFNVESTEIDASGWVAEVNATISRQVPVSTWPANYYTAGGHMLAMTVTAAGNAAMTTVDRPSVTPGAEYMAYCYLSPPVLSSQAWIELRFYDVNGNQIQATRAYLAPPGAGGFYRQRVSANAPTTAATSAVAVGLDGAAAGQVLRVDQLVMFQPVPLVSGSIIPHISANFEQDTGSWTVPSGVATLARSTPWGSAAYFGSYSLAVSSSTATASTIRSPKAGAPKAPGLNWRAQIMAKVGAGSWSTVTVKIRWYDAVGGDLGVSTGTAYSLPSGSWYQLITDAVAPAGTAQAAIEVIAAASASSSVMYVDAAALWQVLPQTAVKAFDADGYIELTLRELPVGDLISVYRVGGDGSRTLVRGSDGLIDQDSILSDAMVIEDHEAPLNTTVSYFIEIYSAPGTLASTRSSTTVALTLSDANTCWLKDPGNPQRNVLVMVSKAPDWQRPIEQSSFVVRGRRNKVVLSGQRQGLEGDLAIWTRSDEERKALHLLLDSGNVLLWQAAPGLGVDDMYVNVAQVTESRVGGPAQEPWRDWTLPLTEADMPITTGINGARGRTWQDILTEFATWQDVLDTYATWEDVLLDRRKR
ncbi:hypothetical protein [Streptomyces antimycoticus]|uniref:hypothetical protein n=1 Tax=Streptomyces TaxID=1883 RepID=UPI0033DEAB10